VWRVKDVIQCVQLILCYDRRVDLELFCVGRFCMEEIHLIRFSAAVAKRIK